MIRLSDPTSSDSLWMAFDYWKARDVYFWVGDNEVNK